MFKNSPFNLVSDFIFLRTNFGLGVSLVLECFILIENQLVKSMEHVRMVSFSEVSCIKMRLPKQNILLNNFANIGKKLIKT